MGQQTPVQLPGESTGNLSYWNYDVMSGKVNRTIYECGFQAGKLYQLLFPEFTTLVRLTSKSMYKKSNKDSLLLFGLHGRCANGKLTPVELASLWRGKILFNNGESNWGHTLYLNNKTFFGIGATDDSSRTVLSTYAGISLVSYYDESLWPRIFNHSHKARSNKRFFCMYAAANCVPFRQESADQISAIGPVSQGGPCSGSNGTLLTKMPSKFRNMPGHTWTRNWELFVNFRFCLVMENVNMPLYITEKILNAFLGGCIPIWYGTEQIFDIFNARGFIYYNISDPEPALERIRYLEHNQTAYDEMQKEVILADGENTIEKYFSFSDKVGNGTLKRRIRTMLGMYPYTLQ
jgi:hypothetical protein